MGDGQRLAPAWMPSLAPLSRAPRKTALESSSGPRLWPCPWQSHTQGWQTSLVGRTVAISVIRGQRPVTAKGAQAPHVHTHDRTPLPNHQGSYSNPTGQGQRLRPGEAKGPPSPHTHTPLPALRPCPCRTQAANPSHCAPKRSVQKVPGGPFHRVGAPPAPCRVETQATIATLSGRPTGSLKITIPARWAILQGLSTQ